METDDSILVVCTANVCRSPMAEAFLADEAERRRLPVTVASAGVHASDGRPASDGSVHALSRRGIDIRDHASRLAAPDLLSAADLIVTMETSHVVEIVSEAEEDPMALFGRTFSLREVVALLESATEPRAGRDLRTYLAALAEGRTPRDVIGRTDLDVEDPVGRSDRRYRRTAAELAELCSSLAVGIWDR